ncbi:MAG: ferritin-like domain-containing protein [Alphaproteobacteria bacterium]
MSAEPPIRIESLEHLIGILGEAAEIEHGLMCCYLYAAFGLKTRESDGLTDDQRAAVTRWRQQIISVAVEEMAHLALVSNILVAIGARPHFTRQNFPVAAGYHPAAMTVALAPFDRDTLDHFIYLERPEGVDMPDAAPFAPPRRYLRGGASGHFTPVAQDFETVGHLYREIAGGLTQLAQQMGEKTLFCGHHDAQIGPDIVSLPGLVTVTDLAPRSPRSKPSSNRARARRATARRATMPASSPCAPTMRRCLPAIPPSCPRGRSRAIPSCAARPTQRAGSSSKFPKPPPCWMSRTRSITRCCAVSYRPMAAPIASAPTVPS